MGSASFEALGLLSCTDLGTKARIWLTGKDRYCNAKGLSSMARECATPGLTVAEH